MKDKILLFIKGVAMGICDVIPGVSGGTIAFITGIYDNLIDSLNSFNLKTLKLVFSGKIKQARHQINGNFLLILFSGIFFAIFTFARIISFLLDNYTSYVWAFFFGLIVVSIFFLKKTIKTFKSQYFVFIIIGILIGYGLTNISVANIGTTNLTMFLSGFIAIIAMILPGISGSYILLILGQYQEILYKVVELTGGNFNAIIPLLIFILGATIGLLSFAKILHYIKTNRHDQMVIILIGFMLGAINKVWPRKKVVETYLDRHGEIQPLIQKNILPTSYIDLILALGLAILGGVVVLTINYLANKYKNR